jgi:hypothetical protein
MHRTDACTVETYADFKCANCKARGHGAADRECPVFKERMKILHAKIPNYAYRFFPTKDPRTWEKDGNELTTAERRGNNAGTGERQNGKARSQEGQAGESISDHGWPREPSDPRGMNGQSRDPRQTGRLTQYRQTRMGDI